MYLFYISLLICSHLKVPTIQHLFSVCAMSCRRRRQRTSVCIYVCASVCKLHFTEFLISTVFVLANFSTNTSHIVPCTVHHARCMYLYASVCCYLSLTYIYFKLLYPEYLQCWIHDVCLSAIQSISLSLVRKQRQLGRQLLRILARSCAHTHTHTHITQKHTQWW